MMKILGVDPGLRHTGWGVIECVGNKLRYVACGVVSPQADMPISLRLSGLSLGLREVLDFHKPDQCAIEETFLNKNPMSSLKLGHARGALMLTMSQAGLCPSEYAATLVKKSIVGVGRAEKNQVLMMVKQLLPGAEIKSMDAADALAVAITHANHS